MNKKFLVIYYLLSPQGRMNQSLLQQASFLKEYYDSHNIVWITFNKTASGLRKLCKEAKLDISKFEFISFYNIFDNKCSKDKTWELVMEHIIEFLFQSLKNAGWDSKLSSAEMILFGGTLAKDFRKCNKIERVIKTNKGMSFSSTKMTVAKSLLAYFLIFKYGIKTHHLIFDPCELLYTSCKEKSNNYFLLHGFEDQKRNFIRCDTLQYFLTNNHKPKVTELKYDFIFGASIVIKEREWVNEIINDLRIDLKNKKSKIFCSNKYSGENTFISRKKYLEYISQSKYTLIIQSYEPNSFSIYRCLEAINAGCLPLFHINSNYSKLCESFDISEEEIGNLVVNGSKDIVTKINTISEIERQKYLTLLYKKLFEDIRLIQK